MRWIGVNQREWWSFQKFQGQSMCLITKAMTQVDNKVIEKWPNASEDLLSVYPKGGRNSSQKSEI